MITRCISEGATAAHCWDNIAFTMHTITVELSFDNYLVHFQKAPQLLTAARRRRLLLRRPLHSHGERQRAAAACVLLCVAVCCSALQ